MSITRYAYPRFSAATFFTNHMDDTRGIFNVVQLKLNYKILQLINNLKIDKQMFSNQKLSNFSLSSIAYCT